MSVTFTGSGFSADTNPPANGEIDFNVVSPPGLVTLTDASDAFKVGDTVSYTTGTRSGTGTYVGYANVDGVDYPVVNLSGIYFAFGARNAGQGPYPFTADDLPCFLAGTRIATPQGEIAVEDLRIGDPVLTLDGSTRPVEWIGRRTVVAAFADPLRGWPIRVKAGALGENTPARDLLLSPDHALLIDGVLIQAAALVNGVSVLRETSVPERFVYFHIELADHALILAEGAPAETFVDNIERWCFDNAAEFEALYPDGKPVAELPYPRAKAARQVPGRVRALMQERSRAIGAAATAA